MAHVLKIIPKGCRESKRIQTLSCLKTKTNNIQQSLDCAQKMKKQLEADIFERENRIKQSAMAGKDFKEEAL